MKNRDRTLTQIRAGLIRSSDCEKHVRTVPDRLVVETDPEIRTPFNPKDQPFSERNQSGSAYF